MQLVPHLPKTVKTVDDELGSGSLYFVVFNVFGTFEIRLQNEPWAFYCFQCNALLCSTLR